MKDVKFKYAGGKLWRLTPEHSLSPLNSRYLQIDNLKKQYPKLKYDREEFLWFEISKFKLPPCFKQLYSSFFVRLFEYNDNERLEYPYDFIPSSFYIDRDIKNKSGDLVCDFMKGFQNLDFDIFNDRWHKGQARFISLIKNYSWEYHWDIISGDDLYMIIEQAHYTLSTFGRTDESVD